MGRQELRKFLKVQTLPHRCLNFFPRVVRIVLSEACTPTQKTTNILHINDQLVKLSNTVLLYIATY